MIWLVIERLILNLKLVLVHFIIIIKMMNSQIELIHNMRISTILPSFWNTLSRSHCNLLILLFLLVSTSSSNRCSFLPIFFLLFLLINYDYIYSLTFQAYLLMIWVQPIYHKLTLTVNYFLLDVFKLTLLDQYFHLQPLSLNLLITHITLPL